MFHYFLSEKWTTSGKEELSAILQVFNKDCKLSNSVDSDNWIFITGNCRGQVEKFPEQYLDYQVYVEFKKMPTC
jgi:hypothetical protein